MRKQERVYLQSVYEERQEISRLGGRWDPKRRAWYVPPNRDLRPFQPWLPADLKDQVQPLPAEPAPSLTPPPDREWDRKSVFVFSGSDALMYQGFTRFLEATGLRTSPWSGLAHLSRHPGPLEAGILAEVFSGAPLVILLTSDERVQIEQDLAERLVRSGPRALPRGERVPKVQPRSDVIFFSGLALGAAPDTTVFVRIGRVPRGLELFYREAAKLSNAIKDRRRVLSRLKHLGCDLDWSGNWSDVGDFGE